jgi:nicotinate-nucleotide adenylyltransferase
VRIGVLGGTFNPPHLGHLICAQEASVSLGLDRVLLIPARVPPHKPVEDEPGAEHRLELCRLAAAGDPRLEVSALEIKRPGTSFTVDTLLELHARAPDSELFLILGSDVAAGLPAWRSPERLLELSTPAVAQRAGTPAQAVSDALERLAGGQRARFFPMPTIEISSTMIRRRVRACESVKYLTPDPVCEYIARAGLYRRAIGDDA